MKKVRVIGGAKSAAGMIYACVKVGKSVSWIIRPSGTGPGLSLSVRERGPYRNVFELRTTRLARTLTPSFFNLDNWRTRSLHGTSLGRKMIWTAADKETRAVFDGRPAMRGFEKLSPHTPYVTVFFHVELRVLRVSGSVLSMSSPTDAI